MAHNNATKVSRFRLATIKCFKRTIKQRVSSLILPLTTQKDMTQLSGLNLPLNCMTSSIRSHWVLNFVHSKNQQLLFLVSDWGRRFPSQIKRQFILFFVDNCTPLQQSSGTGMNSYTRIGEKKYNKRKEEEPV